MAKTDIHYERLKGYGKITLYMHRIGLWLLCTVLSLTAIHLYTMFHFNPLSTKIWTGQAIIKKNGSGMITQ